MDSRVTPKVTDYANSPLHQLAVFRTVRPHPGVYLEAGDIDNGIRTVLAKQRANYNARGLDILLIVVRQLLSFGFHADIPGHCMLTELEKAFLDVAHRDLGWQQAEDWVLKRALLSLLSPSHMPTETPPFRELLAHKQLGHLFLNNKQFRLISDGYLHKPAGTTSVDDDPILFQRRTWDFYDPELRRCNALRADSSKDISKTITQVFNPNAMPSGSRRLLSLRPKFLRVTLRVSKISVPISQLRYLRFRAPESTGDDQRHVNGIQVAAYQLCAVVRTHLGSEGSERVRTYWKDGTEIVPAEVGAFQQKEPEELEGSHWGVEDPGEYELFYFRIYQPQDWQGQIIDEHAEESQVRAWLEELLSTQGGQTISSPIIPSSSRQESNQDLV